MKPITQFVNLTPHVVVVHKPDGTKLEFKPDGTVARVEVNRGQTHEVAGIPVFGESYGDVVGLPAPVDGVGYIVSAMVRQASPMRWDVFSPGDLVRDEKGAVIGCRGIVGN